MKRLKNGVTHYNAADIDAALGIVPEPLRDGFPVLVHTPAGTRKHIALAPDVPRALCGVNSGVGDPNYRRYDLDDERFNRRSWTCSKCRDLAAPLGIESTPW